MTETFERAWLALREPVDHRSRPRAPLAPLVEWWAAGGHSSVLDLGCGTGSNLRWLAPELPGSSWTLLDHDAELLSSIQVPECPWGEPDVRPVTGDLATEGLVLVDAADLVTASALLDLVSEAWLRSLVDACAAGDHAALFALTYDGTIEWGGDPDPLDDVVRDAVNEHQRRDKGIGAALGPAAADTAERLFAAAGYATTLAGSPWELGPADGRLIEALVDGWASAAAEQRPEGAGDFAGWAARRRTCDARLTVGHLDLLAIPGPR